MLLSGIFLWHFESVNNNSFCQASFGLFNEFKIILRPPVALAFVSIQSTNFKAFDCFQVCSMNARCLKSGHLSSNSLVGGLNHARCIFSLRGTAIRTPLVSAESVSSLSATCTDAFCVEFTFNSATLQCIQFSLSITKNATQGR